MGTWRENVNHMHGRDRNQKTVELLRSRNLLPNAVVADIGSGMQVLRELLPPDVTYMAVDLQQRVQHPTICYDLNSGAKMPPELGRSSVIVFNGSMEYVTDKARCMSMCRSLAPKASILWHYNLGTVKKSATYEWVSPLSCIQIKQLATDLHMQVEFLHPHTFQELRDPDAFGVALFALFTPQQ